MKRIDKMNPINKQHAELCILFMIAGIIWLIASMSFMFTFDKTTATISKIEKNVFDDDPFSYIYVNYEYEGGRYKDVRLDNRMLFKARQGDTIEIYCNPKEPKDIKYASSITFLPCVVIFGSLIALLVGFANHDSETMPELEEDTLVAPEFYDSTMLINVGLAVMAEITEIRCDYSSSLGDKSPYIIECIYFDEKTANSYLFESKPVWFNPNEFTSIGSKIKVFVNIDNYENYYVYTESLNDSFLPM